MTNSAVTVNSGYFAELKGTGGYDADLEPFASLFLKPLTHNKSAFTKKELEVMCKDPMHSPRLIMYLIESIKNM